MHTMVVLIPHTAFHVCGSVKRKKDKILVANLKNDRTLLFDLGKDAHSQIALSMSMLNFAKLKRFSKTSL